MKEEDLLKPDQPIPGSFKPSEWLSCVVPQRKPFFPQIGDEVVYFKQGIRLYKLLCVE